MTSTLLDDMFELTHRLQSLTKHVTPSHRRQDTQHTLDRLEGLLVALAHDVEKEERALKAIDLINIVG